MPCRGRSTSFLKTHRFSRFLRDFLQCQWSDMCHYRWRFNRFCYSLTYVRYNYNQSDRVFHHGVSSSNCAALCTQFSTAHVQLIWLPLCSRLMPADHAWVNVAGQRRRQTSHYHSYVPSLESVLSRTPVPLHGTHCPNTSVLNLTLVFLGNCWRHIFLT